MSERARAWWFVMAAASAACGGGSTATPTEDAATDATTEDLGLEGAADGDLDASDAGPPDTGPPDTGAPDTGSATFACGTETCGKKFQICRRAPTPTSCPSDETGPCPAGCPGCAALPYGCAALPGTCFSFPSCPCLRTVLCGGAGTCTEVDGAYTVACP